MVLPIWVVLIIAGVLFAFWAISGLIIAIDKLRTRSSRPSEGQGRE